VNRRRVGGRRELDRQRLVEGGIVQQHSVTEMDVCAIWEMDGNAIVVVGCF
jgi:hypothetical protein